MKNEVSGFKLNIDAFSKNGRINAVMMSGNVPDYWQPRILIQALEGCRVFSELKGQDLRDAIKNEVDSMPDVI